MRIGVDIDGVLFPWDTVAREAIADRFGINLGPSDRWYAIKETAGKPAWKWLWSREGQDHVFGQVSQCYPDAVEAVRALILGGHKVHFVTHRDPARTLGHTAAFLEAHFQGTRWAGVHSARKTPKRTLGPWDVFVDDKPDTVRDFVANTGARVFAPRRTWNAELGVYVFPTFTYYDDPWAIVDWAERA